MEELKLAMVLLAPIGAVVLGVCALIAYSIDVLTGKEGRRFFPDWIIIAALCLTITYYGYTTLVKVAGVMGLL